VCVPAGRYTLAGGGSAGRTTVQLPQCGLPKSVFDDLQAQLAANRSVFYRALPSGSFYGFNRPGVKPVEAVIQNWWRQGMMGGAKAHYDGIVASSPPPPRPTSPGT
jgi:hypothetical protein